MDFGSHEAKRRIEQARREFIAARMLDLANHVQFVPEDRVTVRVEGGNYWRGIVTGIDFPIDRPVIYRVNQLGTTFTHVLRAEDMALSLASPLTGEYAFLEGAHVLDSETEQVGIVTAVWFDDEEGGWVHRVDFESGDMTECGWERLEEVPFHANANRAA